MYNIIIIYILCTHILHCFTYACCECDWLTTCWSTRFMSFSQRCSQTIREANISMSGQHFWGKYELISWDLRPIGRLAQNILSIEQLCTVSCRHDSRCQIVPTICFLCQSIIISEHNDIPNPWVDNSCGINVILVWNVYPHEWRWRERNCNISINTNMNIHGKLRIVQIKYDRIMLEWFLRFTSTQHSACCSQFQIAYGVLVAKHHTCMASGTRKIVHRRRAVKRIFVCHLQRTLRTTEPEEVL